MIKRIERIIYDYSHPTRGTGYGWDDYKIYTTDGGKYSLKQLLSSKLGARIEFCKFDALPIYSIRISIPPYEYGEIAIQYNLADVFKGEITQALDYNELGHWLLLIQDLSRSTGHSISLEIEEMPV